MVRFVLLLAFTIPVFAEGFHFGLRAGVPLTAYFETGSTGSLHGSSEYSAATRRYTLGPSLEWYPARRFGLEVDVLYKRMGYVGIVNFFGNGISTTTSIDVKGNSWDFPLLLKYRFGHRVRLYLAGGAVLRYVGPVRGQGEVKVDNLITGTTTRTPLDTTEPSDLRKRFYPGVAASGGVEWKTGRLRLLPEFRYTRWTANIAGPGGTLRFNPNQAEFLLGILF